MTESIRFNGFNKEEIEKFMNHKLVGFLERDMIAGEELYSTLYYFDYDEFGNKLNTPLVIDIGQTIIKKDNGNYCIL